MYIKSILVPVLNVGFQAPSVGHASLEINHRHFDPPSNWQHCSGPTIRAATTKRQHIFFVPCGMQISRGAIESTPAWHVRSHAARIRNWKTDPAVRQSGRSDRIHRQSIELVQLAVEDMKYVTGERVQASWACVDLQACWHRHVRRYVQSRKSGTAALHISQNEQLVPLCLQGRTGVAESARGCWNRSFERTPFRPTIPVMQLRSR
jgi:hypothetical protein